MNERLPTEDWEAWLQATAQTFEYPPTPAITAVVLSASQSQRRGGLPVRRRALAVALLIVLLLGLWSVPQVRAGVRAILRIGAVEIVLPTPAPLHRPSAAPPPATPSPTVPPSPTIKTALQELAGATTLSDARRQLPFPIHLPSYPSDLGVPDRVFVQDLNGPAVILIWLEPNQPEHTRLSLHLLSSDLLMRKSMVTELTQTTVNGRSAAWVIGPHLIEVYLANGGRTIAQRQLVDGNTLIWTAGTLTYRLETRQSLTDAVRTAESVH